MKTTFIHALGSVLLWMALLGYSGDLYAKSATVSVHVFPVLSQSTDPDKIELDPHGRRIPSFSTLCCVIDSEIGIQFNCATPPEIISYEVWTADGLSIATFDSEMAFIEALFSMTGSYQIVFVAENCAYVGMICI